MSFIAGYLLGLEDGGGGVIKSITITENGTYNAADYGCDGFNPVYVNVPDRYDEGYQDGYADGYSDASDIYQTIINQLNGDGENVTDDEGNEITNAVVTPSDALENYLTHLVCPSKGGSVTCQGLDGDTSFKFEVYVRKIIYTDGSTAYSTNVKLTTTNLVTGQEYVRTTNGYSSLAGEPAHRVKITDVSVSSSAVDIKFDFINGSTGEIINYSTVSTTVSTVGGTAFVGSKDIASTVTQNSEPNEIEDYS